MHSDYKAFIIGADISESLYRMDGAHQYWGDGSQRSHVLAFSQIGSPAYGGALEADFQLILENFKELIFSRNSASSDLGSAAGGAIYGSEIVVSGNGSVVFSGNTSAGCGNAPTNDFVVTLDDFHKGTKEFHVLGLAETVIVPVMNLPQAKGALENSVYVEGNCTFAGAEYGCTFVYRTDELYREDGLPTTAWLYVTFESLESVTSQSTMAALGMDPQGNGLVGSAVELQLDFTTLETQVLSSTQGTVTINYPDSLGEYITFDAWMRSILDANFYVARRSWAQPVDVATFCGGGAVYVEPGGSLRIEDNDYAEFNANSTNGNGGVIYGSKCSAITLKDNGSVIFRENAAMGDSGDGGAIYGDSSNAINLSSNVGIEFNGNFAHSDGGAIAAFYSEVSLTNNGSVMFSGNSTDDDGGAIYACSGCVIMAHNESVTFNGNACSDDGGAVYVFTAGSMAMSHNESVTFGGNSCSDDGGAIYAESSRVSLNDNGSVIFAGNTAAGSGGAVCGSDIVVSGNASVVFSGNASAGVSMWKSNDFLVTLNDFRKGKKELHVLGLAETIIVPETNLPQAKGALENSVYVEGYCNFAGADYGCTFTYRTDELYHEDGLPTMGWLYITFESLEATTSSSTMAALGLDPQGNGLVGSAQEIQFNFTTLEAQVLSTTQGTVTINYPDPLGEYITFDAWVRSVMNANFYVSKRSGIQPVSLATVYGGGAVYVETGGSLHIEGNDYVEFRGNHVTDGETTRLMGVCCTGGNLVLSAGQGQEIVFHDALYAKEGTLVSFNANYLDKKGVTQKGAGDIVFSGKHAKEDLAALKANYTLGELQASMTTEVYATTNLYGGRLRIEDGAIYKGNGINVAANSNATLCLVNGTLDQTGYNVTLNSGARLDLRGVNNITASALNMQSGSSLSFTLGKANQAAAALTLTGTFNQGGALSLLLSSDGIIEMGQEYALLQLEDGDVPSTWNWAKINVSGLEATKSDLSWKDGTLYYVAPAPPELVTATWSGSESMVWNTTDENWKQRGYVYRYKNGVDVVFDDTGSAGAVTLVGTLAPKSVSVKNSSGHDYIWSGSGKLAGGMVLTKSGNGTLIINMANSYTGGTTISSGMLHVGNKSALGTGTVKLAGGALEIAAGGFANTITASGNSTLKVASGTALALSKAISNTGALTMSGTFNASGLTLTQGAATHVDVNGNTGNSGFTKSGGYSVTLVSGGSTVNGGAIITHGNLPTGLELTLGTNGVATAGGTVDYSDYLLTGSDTVASSDIHAWNAGATVTQKGGTLTVDDATTVNTTGGTVKLTKAVMLGGSISNAAVTASAGTITASMSGSTSLTTSGNVTLSGAKTYTGSTTILSDTLTLGGGLKSDITINGGTLDTGNGLTLSSGQNIQLKSGGISGNLTIAAGASVTIMPSAATIDGTLALKGGTLSLDDNRLIVTGALTLSDKTTLALSGSYGYGEHTLVSAGSIGGSTTLLTVTGLNNDFQLFKRGGNLVLSVSQPSGEISFSHNVTWTVGGSGYTDGSMVTFSGSCMITMSGEVSPGSMTVTGNGSITWEGKGTVTGNASLVMSSSGTLNIKTSNTYTGGTEIRQGAVNVQANNALGTGSVKMWGGSSLMLNGNNLGQNDVTVQGNATLAAGNGGQVKSLIVSTQRGVQGHSGELLYAEKLTLKGSLTTESLKLTKGNIEGGTITITGEAIVEQGCIASNIIGKTLEKTGDSRVELKGENKIDNVSVSCGQLALLETGSLMGAVSVRNKAALLAGVTVNGDISLASGAHMHLRPGAVYELSRKLTANSGAEFHGNLATKDGATLTLGAAVQSGNAFSVHGSLTLGGGSLAYTGSISKGTTYTLVTTTDGISNTSGKTLYTLFNLSEAGYTIGNTGNAITLQQKMNVSQALQRVAAQGVPAGLAVEGEPAGEDGVIVVGTAPEVQYTEAPLTETAVNGVTDAMVQADWGVAQGARAFAGTLNGSHGNLRSLGNGRTAVWANAFGSTTRQSSNRGHAGADHQLTGASLGLETMVGSHGAAGIAIGHTWNRVNTFGMSRLRQDAQHAGAFGRARVASSGTNTVWIEGSAAYGKAETRGQLGYSRERWTQNSGTLNARVNDVLQLTESTALNFYGGLEYLATDSGRIEDLRTGSVQNLRGELGAGITHRIGSGVVFAEAALQGDMVRHNPQADVGIRQRGANPGRIGGSITVGGAYSLGEHWSVNAAYTFEGAKHNNSHNASVGATYRF